MRKTYKVTLFVLLSVVTGFAMFLRHQTAMAELRRKHYGLAHVVSLDLMQYKEDHNGQLPRSLDELPISKQTDLSQFELRDPQVRKGETGNGVMAEAEGLRDRDCHIVIYEDGVVRWENRPAH